MRTSYSQDDVILLLKDITGMVKTQNTEEREALIQAGKHYSEMLPVEYRPTKKYMEIYTQALRTFSDATADAIANLSDKIIEKKGRNVVLVSLARAGTPVGILIKRYIKKKYNEDVLHYSISIIRGRGIDDNAMKHILSKHSAKDLQFVDGWIGKGAILNELKKNMEKYEGVSSEIAVVADPANVTELCGTHEDILIPSSCLNSTVSGLVSRTFYRNDIIKENDFHGAMYYEEYEKDDLSYQFIEEIESKFEMETGLRHKEELKKESKGIDEVNKIALKYDIEDINLIKPGIGETTRVLLRRVPWKVLIDEKYKESIELKHIVRLAHEKDVLIEYCSLLNYKCVGIIKKLADA